MALKYGDLPAGTVTQRGTDLNGDPTWYNSNDWEMDTGSNLLNPYRSEAEARAMRADPSTGPSWDTPQAYLGGQSARQRMYENGLRSAAPSFGERAMGIGIPLAGAMVTGGAAGFGPLSGAGTGAGAAGAAGGSMDFGLGDWGSFDPGGGGVGGLPDWSTPPYFGQEGGGFPGEPTGQYGGPTGMPPPSDPGLLDYIRKIPGIGNILSKIPGSGPNGQQTDQDLMRTLGSIFGSGLGYLGSGEERRMYQNLADRYWGAGAPYRQRLEQTYTDPMAWLKSPEVQAPIQQGSDIMARSLSTQGNPAGSGNALQQLQNYSSNQLFGRLGEERTRLGNLGGLPMAGSQAASTNAITAAGNQYNAVGAGMNDIFNPPRTLAQSLNEYRRLQGAMT